MRPILSLALVSLLVPASAWAQCVEEQLVGSDTAAGDRFGGALSADGDWVVVGAESAGPSGAAYVFERVAGQLVERQKLLPAGGGGQELFGAAVAVHGDRLAVGAPLADGTGRVYLYGRQGPIWVFEQTVRPVTITTGDQFGAGVALWDDVLLAGAPLAGSFSFPGGAWVFRRSGGSWNEEQAFAPPAAWGSARIGSEVDIEGERLVIAAPYADVGAAYAAGGAMVCEFDGQTWNVTAELETNDPQDLDEVGRGGITLSGNTVAAGAWLAGGWACCTPGYVYVWEESGGSWSQAAKLEADDAIDGAAFGSSVDLAGDTLLIGAWGDPQMGINAGAAYVFERAGGLWSQREKRLPRDGFAFERAGKRVALHGGRALVGAYAADAAGEGAGAVYDFDLSAPPSVLAQPFCYGTQGCGCGNTAQAGGCLTSLGIASELRACGTASVSADDLALTLSHVLPGQFGLVFMGGGTTDVVFGDGRLCVAPGAAGLYRFPIRSTGPTGSFLETDLVSYSMQNFGASGAIVAGATWSFQGWFRDPAPPPCDLLVTWNATLPGHVPSGFNLSNALRVTFGP